jgi:hypothetical protein
MLAGPECPVAAVSEGVLRPHLAGQLVERLGAEGGVLYPIGRDDAVSDRGQSGDEAGCQDVGIATRCFVDRVRDDPLDGRAIAFRHPALSRAVVHAALTPPASRRCRPGLVAFGKPPYLPNMTHDLTNEETAALVRLLSDTIDNDRYPLSHRIQTLKAILAKIRPEPVREPLPPLKVYAPPRAKGRRRG